MKYWKKATDEHIVYEALTAIADKRIEIENKKDDRFAKVFSSSRNKFYTVKFDLEKMLFMSDDNMAYYRDEVSYPMLAVLLKENKIFFDENLLPYFKNIAWKDINQKNKNDYMKSVEEFLNKVADIHSPEKSLEIKNNCLKIFTELNKLDLEVLGEKILPPQTY